VPNSRPGDEEQSFPAVWGSHRGRRKHCPLRIEPQRGKVTEGSLQLPSPNNGWDVLADEQPGSKYAKGSGDLRP